MIRVFFSLSCCCDLHLCFYAPSWHPKCRELLFSVGNREIFWLRACKSPVIADHPGARYSPDTENGFYGNARSPATGRLDITHRRRRQGAAERGNPFDNTMRKHGTALWLCLTQSEGIPLSLQLTMLTCYKACGFTAPQYGHESIRTACWMLKTWAFSTRAEPEHVCSETKRTNVTIILVTSVVL